MIRQRLEHFRRTVCWANLYGGKDAQSHHFGPSFWDTATKSTLNIYRICKIQHCCKQASTLHKDIQYILRRIYTSTCVFEAWVPQKRYLGSHGSRERSIILESIKRTRRQTHFPSSTVPSGKDHLNTSLSGSPTLELAVKVVLRNGSATKGHLDCSTGGYSFVATKLNASAVAAYCGPPVTMHRSQ